MKRGRLPLTALRSFEAAGRLESVTRAAEELFVSQAAISRQIRGLEEQLGQPLFERHHRAVRLTVAGRMLLSELVACFDRMETALQSAQQAAAPRALVRISVEPAFASAMLLPALPEFAADNPDIDIQVESDPRIMSFRGNGPALALRYSARAQAWPKTQARRLYDCEMGVVAAPALLAGREKLETPADLLSLPLVHEEDRGLWRAWFAAAGLAGPMIDAADTAVDRGPIYDDAALVIQAALRGQGAAVVGRSMVKDDLESGRLVRLFDASVYQGAYFLVARDFARLTPQARRFADWLCARFGESGCPL